MLNYVVNQASINVAIAQNQRLLGSINAGAQQAIAAGKQTAQAVNVATGALNGQITTLGKLQTAFADIGKQNSLDKLAKDAAVGTISVNALATELQSLGATDAQINQVASSMARLQAQAAAGAAAGPATLGQRITGVGRSLFAAPDIGGVSTPIARGLIGGGAAVDALGLSLKQVGALAGVAGVGLVAVKVAFDAFNASLERSRGILRAALVAQDNYYTALAQSTTEQVNEQIADLQRTRPLLEAQLKETRDTIISAFGENTLTDEFGMGRFNRGLAKIISPDLFTALDAAQTALDENIQTEVRLTQGRDAGAFAANTLVETERLLLEARRAASSQMYQELFQNIDQTMATNLKLADLRRDGTKEQVDALLAENSDKERLLRNFAIPAAEAAATSEEGKAKLEAYRNELAELLRMDELLLAGVLPIIEAREREAAAVALITTQNDNYLKQLDLELKIRDELTATLLRINEIEAQRDEKLRTIAADDREKRGDIEREAAEKREEIARESVERINKILRDGGREQMNAVAERDTLAFLMSKQRETDALADQKQADEKAAANLARQIARQEEQQRRAYEKQFNQAVAAAQKELDAQRHHQAQLNVDLLNAQAGLQAIAQSGSGGLQVIHNNMWANINTLSTNWANTIAARVGQALWGIGDGASGIGPGGIGGGIGGVLGGLSMSNYTVPNFLPGVPDAPYIIPDPSPRKRGLVSGTVPGVDGGAGGGITLHYSPTANGMDLRATLHAFDDRFIAYLRQTGVIR